MHYRLGHPNDRVLIETLRRSLVDGEKISFTPKSGLTRLYDAIIDRDAVPAAKSDSNNSRAKSDEDESSIEGETKSPSRHQPLIRALDTCKCLTCKLVKAQKLSIRPTQRVVTIPGQMICSDLVGKMPVEGLGRQLYAQHSIDVATRKEWISNIRKKSDGSATLKNLIGTIELELKRPCEIFRTDNGTELKKFTTWATTEKEPPLKLELSPPHVPELNGMIERAHDPMTKRTNALLTTANLPHQFWTASIEHAIDIHNILWSNVTNGVPNAMWTGKDQEIGHLRIFGCLVVVWIPPQERKKFDHHGEPGLLMGYVGTKIKKVYLYRTGAISLESHVVYFEDRFPGLKKSEYPWVNDVNFQAKLHKLLARVDDAVASGENIELIVPRLFSDAADEGENGSDQPNVQIQHAGTTENDEDAFENNLDMIPSDYGSDSDEGEDHRERSASIKSSAQAPERMEMDIDSSPASENISDTSDIHASQGRDVATPVNEDGGRPGTASPTDTETLQIAALEAALFIAQNEIEMEEPEEIAPAPAEAELVLGENIEEDFENSWTFGGNVRGKVQPRTRADDLQSRKRVKPFEDDGDGTTHQGGDMLGANPDNDSDNESVDLGWTKLHASSKNNSHMAALAQGVDPMLLAMEFAVIKDPTSKPPLKESPPAAFTEFTEQLSQEARNYAASVAEKNVQRAAEIVEHMFENLPSASAATPHYSKGRLRSQLTPLQEKLNGYVLELLNSGTIKTNVPEFDINVSELGSAPTSANEAFTPTNPLREFWMGATLAEMEAHRLMGTFEMVPDTGDIKSIIGSKLVFAFKIDERGKLLRFKARLVATGYTQKEGIDYFDTYAPVGRIQTIRFLVALALFMGLELEQMDVSTAFLYAELKEPNFMRMPPGFRTYDENGREFIAKLRRALYGLHQSSNAWFKTVRDHLCGKGYTQAVLDPCLFFKIDRANRRLKIILVYVDDMILIANSKEDMAEIKQMFKDAYEMKDLGAAKYLIGIQIERRKNGIWLGQPRYTQEILTEAEIWNDSEGNPMKSKPSPLPTGWKVDKSSELLDASRHHTFRSNLMKVSYLSQQTRPDLSQAVSALAAQQQNPTEHDERALKHVFRYLRGSWDWGLLYKRNRAQYPSFFTEFGQESLADLLVGYCDSSFGEEFNRFSRHGYVFLFDGAAIDWISKVQSTFAVSSTQAEYNCLEVGSRNAVGWRNLFSELFLIPSKPTLIYEDNKSALHQAEQSSQYPKVKHYAMKTHYIRWAVEKQMVRLEYCPTEDMLADIFTKPLPPARFEKLRAGMGMISLSDLESTLANLSFA